VLGAILAAVLASTLIAPAAPAAAVPAASRVAATSSNQSAAYWGPDRDIDGDGYPDVLAIAGNGDLRLYTGTSSGTVTGGARIGTGWAGFDQVFVAGDFSGDGLPDVMARDRSGNLHLYRGNGSGGWLGGSRIGTGWQGFTAILSPGDFNGDGTADVIARDGSGRLFLYPGNGAGGWLRASQIGTGWSDFRFLIGAGDMNLDGANDLTVVKPGIKVAGQWMCSGVLDLGHYHGTGTGGFSGPPYYDGYSWCKFSAVIDGGHESLIARDASGNLLRYQRGQNRWGHPVWVGSMRIGTGWNGLRLVG
jgi:hypothetical protein